MNARYINIKWSFVFERIFIGLVIILFTGYLAYAIWAAASVYFVQNYDPEFIYFLDSLHVLQGHNYYYIDHPGTPVEMLGSLIIGLTYPFLAGAESGFTQFHLDHPGLFFILAYSFLTVMSMACLFYFYVTAKNASRSRNIFAAAALAVMFYVIHALAFQTLAAWSHNSFNFPFGTLLLLFLFNALAESKEIPIWKVFVLGVAAGLLTAVTIYFGAWVIGGAITVFAFYRLAQFNWHKTLIATLSFLLSSMLGFGLALIPIYTRLDKFIAWMKNLIFHQGIYSSGPEGITSLPTLLNNLSYLIRVRPIVFGLLAFEIILFIYASGWRRDKLKQTPGLWALGIGLIFQALAATLMLAKHPGDKYILAIAASVPVLMMVLWAIFENELDSHKGLQGLLIFMVFCGFFFSFYRAIVDQSRFATFVRGIQEQSQRVIEEVAASDGRQPGQLTILWSYGSYAPCYALWFGNDYVGMKFGRQIQNMCGNQYEFNVWSNIIPLPQGKNAGLQEFPWDVLVVCRTRFETVPELKEVGNVYNEIEADSLCGSLVFIVHPR